MSVRAATRLRAWILLGRSMAVQMAALPFRKREGGDGGGGRAFLAVVAPEGYLPLTASERAEFPAFTRCVSCGLCALACPALRDAPAAAWAEAWTFVVGPSRMLERAALAAASLERGDPGDRGDRGDRGEPCARCAACAAV